MGGPDDVRGNATACYRKLHPRSKQRTCESEGSKILRKPKVQEYINQRIEELKQNTNVTVEWVLQKSVEYFETCMAQREIPEKMTVPAGPDGEEKEITVMVTKFSPAAAGKALELIGKNILVQAYQEKVDVTGQVDLASIMQQRQKQVEAMALKRQKENADSDSDSTPTRH